MAPSHPNSVSLAASDGPVADRKRQILDALKRVDGATVTELAERFEVSTVAVRQHLDVMAGNGLVELAEPTRPTGRGRPAARWRLSALANELFPDRHRDLTLDLIDAIREAVGEVGLDAVVSARTSRQRDAYEAIMPAGAPLRDRVEALAAQRSAEGYVAEAAQLGDAAPSGAAAFQLVEHHCPICEAATSCTSLCRDELELFQSVLGSDVVVERTTHIVSGDARCSYTVTPVSLG